jgi:hypothetical protein
VVVTYIPPSHLTFFLELHCYRSAIIIHNNPLTLGFTTLHWNQKTKSNVVLRVGNVHRVQRCTYSLFSSCLMQPSQEFCVTETVHQTRYCKFVWHRRIEKCIPKLFLASQVVVGNEHSLHLWKRHPCTSNVERQLTDWREQVTTWRDLHGLLYSNSDMCVC